MVWQACDSLGALLFNERNFTEAEGYFLEALKNVGSDAAAQNRIMLKLKQVVRAIENEELKTELTPEAAKKDA